MDVGPWLLTVGVLAGSARAAAQCTVTGDAVVPSVVLHDDLELRDIALEGIEIEWPPGDDDRTTGRLRSPIDAPAVFQAVPFRLATGARLPSGFFDVPRVAFRRS